MTSFELAFAEARLAVPGGDDNRHQQTQLVRADYGAAGHDVIAEECDNPLPDIRIREAGYVPDSGGYGLAAFRGLAQGPSSRLRQRDEGVPRRPGGPPHLGCCCSY